MKRSTRKVKWQKTNKNYAVGVICQRGKPDSIIIKIRKGFEDQIRISMDTIPSSYVPEPDPAILEQERKDRIAQALTALGIKHDQ